MESEPIGPVGPVGLVAVVASAGGLQAITHVLLGLPAPLSVPVVVAQHLSARGSQLLDILARQVPHEVVWAEEGASLRPGTVTLCPAGLQLEILPDVTCALRPLGSVVTDRPFDRLLSSVAQSFGRRGVAVVLTGMGRDGSAGAAQVHAAGGTVLAQSPESAEHPSMPSAVAELGVADRVLPLHELAGAVAGCLAGDGLPRDRQELSAARALFAGPGEVAALGRTMDWGQTGLGPVGPWPAVLGTTVRLMLAAPLPVIVLWGPDRVQIYNDHYRGLMGDKHPGGLGQANRECWPEVWHLNEGLYARVQAGESVAVRDALYPITRHGMLEDAWFDLFFQPVRDDREVVTGILGTVVEKTGEVLSARRLRALHQLADRTAGSASVSGVLRETVATLGAVDDFVLGLTYDLDDPDGLLTLVEAGSLAEGPVTRPRVRLGEAGSWPFQAAAEAGEPLFLRDVEERFGEVFGADGTGPVTTAVVSALREPGGERADGFLVLGLNPRLPLDDAFRDFVGLACREVSARVTEARIRERERLRLGRLAELDRLKTEFFSNVSHEFRTPLTLILSPLEHLLSRRGELPGELAADVELAERNARRLLRLVTSLLDFSRAGSGQLHAQYRPTDLAALTTDITTAFRRTIEQLDLTLTVDAPTLPEPVWVDADMWEKVLSNLLSNAVKFTFRGGVEVRVRALPQHAEVEVEDTGVGIPSAELPNLFSRFHQVRGTLARTHEGAGIGLALVDELVRAHHGRVRVRSTVGEGTCFTVWLPLGRRPGQEEAPGLPDGRRDLAEAMAEEASRWETGSTVAELNPTVLDLPGDPVEVLVRRRPGARVLVVDDHADMRDYLTRLLRARWDVVTAADGHAALAAVRDEPPDLVLADVMMPGLDGFGFLRALRDDPRLARLPVILVTARAGEEAGVEGLLAGADDYVVKPFSARELVARVGAQLELARMRRREEDRLRALVTASWDVVYRMNPDWSRMWALDGRGFLNDTDQPTTSWLEEYIPAGIRPTVLDAIDEAVTQKRIFELEHPVVRADGSTGWTLSRAVPLVDEEGRITEWLGTATDVTDQRIDGASASILWTADAGGAVTEDSPSWREFTGQSEGQFLGRGWLGAVHPDDRSATDDAWTRAVAARAPAETRFRLRHAASQSWHPAQVRAVPLRRPDGSLRGWVGLVTDLSDL